MKAKKRVERACENYPLNHDGDAWLADVNTAQNELDSFDPDAEHHAGILVEKRDNVPRNASAYILFLITSPNFDQGIPNLRSAFDEVGKAIGSKNLAIWFESPHDSDQVDIDRSRWYCDHVFHFEKLGLDYSSGPYIVVTSSRPDTWTNASDIVILKLAALSEDRTLQLLDSLVQEIRVDGTARRSTLLFKEVVARFLSARDKNPDVFRNVTMLIFGQKAD